MHRRDFLVASGIGAMFAGMGARALAEAGNRQLYELRHYLVPTADKREKLVRFFANGGVAALNRLGVKPVGVFQYAEEVSYDLWVLLPYENLGQLLAVHTQLLNDKAVQLAAKELFAAPMDDPVYQGIESSLLLAFEGMPHLEQPASGPERVFQLRTYQSHTLEKAALKIDMFNNGGELAIFRRVGLTPVFFGQSLVGSRLPNLTYMLGFDSPEKMEEAWVRFRKDPEWLKLKDEEKYKDTVSNIINIVLKPTEASQI